MVDRTREVMLKTCPETPVDERPPVCDILAMLAIQRSMEMPPHFSLDDFKEALASENHPTIEPTIPVAALVAAKNAGWLKVIRAAEPRFEFIPGVLSKETEVFFGRIDQEVRKEKVPARQEKRSPATHTFETLAELQALIDEGHVPAITSTAQLRLAQQLQRSMFGVVEAEELGSAKARRLKPGQDPTWVQGTPSYRKAMMLIHEGLKMPQKRLDEARKMHASNLFITPFKVRSARKHEGEDIDPDEWFDHAICRDVPPSRFFPSTGAEVEQVIKEFCKDCPVRGACGEHAIQNRIDHGVWGGMSERERRRVIKSRRRMGR